MFNRRRSFGLYYAIGIAAGALVLAGAGTYYFMSRSQSARGDVVAQRKRAVSHKSKANNRMPAHKSNHVHA